MKIHGLLGFVIKNSRGIVIPMVCASVLAGLFSAGVIGVVSRTLIRHDASYLLAIAFAALVVGRIVATAAAPPTGPLLERNHPRSVDHAVRQDLESACLSTAFASIFCR
jgi:Na+/H+-dicarboxylate symporter